jgi:hypothetical protein
LLSTVHRISRLVQSIAVQDANVNGVEGECGASASRDRFAKCFDPEQSFRFVPQSDLDGLRAAGVRRGAPHARCCRMRIDEFAEDQDGSMRDFVMIVDEESRNECQEASRRCSPTSPWQKTSTMISTFMVCPRRAATPEAVQ